MKDRIYKINAFEKLDNFEKHYLHSLPQNYLNLVLLSFEWDTNLWHYLIIMVMWKKEKEKKWNLLCALEEIFFLNLNIWCTFLHILNKIYILT